MKGAALLVTILAFCFTSCENLLHDDLGAGKSAGIHDKKTPEKPAKNINYTVTSDKNTHTDNIVFSFDGDVKELKAKDIHITNKSGSVKKGKLSGSGAYWSLEVTASTPGKIEVKIVKPGIEGKKKKMNVYHLHINSPDECDICGEEKCSDNCDEYDCHNCKNQGCDECTDYNCYYCKDTGCDACTEYNCYYCKDTGCDACRAY